MRTPFFALSCLAALAPTAKAVSYCLPGDSCFPSDAELQQFNSSIQGRLIKAVPYALACYEDSYDAEVCKALAAKRQDSAWRMSLPAGLIYTTWEQVGDQGCYLPLLPADGSAPAPIQGNCTLGGMSSYVVNATNADDIAKTVKFAAEKKLRLRVKNTGHEYLGRSAGAGSFAIWTHYMNDLHVVDDFGTGCGDASQQVISAGPGVLVDQLYAFGAKHNVITAGGFCPTVGATGGFIIGGGTGPWATTLGLGVDNVVQFEVVTADGEKKTVNKCSEPDLFWAMRGGGGVFAVTTRVFLKTHKQPEAVNYMVASIGCDGKSSFDELISTMVDLQVSLREKGQAGGLWTASTKTHSVMLITLSPQFSSPTPINATLSAWAPAFTIRGCTATPQAGSKPQWYDVYRGPFWALVSGGAPSGTNILDASRIVTYADMADAATRQRIKDYITNLDPRPTFLWQNTVGAATRLVDPADTSVNPVWRDAFAFMNMPVAGPVYAVTPEQVALQRENMRNATLAIGTAAYYNEANEYEEDWQESFFGGNYERLLEIKDRVDPGRVFNCRLCVGSEGGF